MTELLKVIIESMLIGPKNESEKLDESEQLNEAPIIGMVMLPLPEKE